MELKWQVPGVSRVALITGLDRSGVEVACAIRPRGHVLQVCNGKGPTADIAKQGALLEAAELGAAETLPSALELTWASRSELRAAAPDHDVYSLQDCESSGALCTPALAHDDLFMAWCRGVELHTGAPVWLPAQAIHCPPPGGRSLGPVALAWTTNGMGAHPAPQKALLHALLEAVERSELALALPHGWTQAAVQRRALSWNAFPRAAAIEASLRTRGFQAHLFDVAPPRGIGLPVRAALLVDEERGPVPLTAGYACRLDADEAACAALLEAAQSRLTEIHGAREEVAHEEADVSPLLEWLSKTKRGSAGADAKSSAKRTGQPSAVRAARGRNARLDPPALGSLWAKAQRSPEVKHVLTAMRRAGYTRAAAAVLTAGAPAGVTVVKVVVPGFLRSELLG